MNNLRAHLIKTLWRGIDPFDHVLGGKETLDLQGWGSQHRFLTDSIEEVRPSIVVEIGVWKGGSTITMASQMKKLGIPGVVIAVDTWLGAWDHWINDLWFNELRIKAGYPTLFQQFSANVRESGLKDYVLPLPLDSVNAARVLEKFNLRPEVIHIDAGHDYAAVSSDLNHWWPALKPGGVLIGDDYREGNNWPDVKRAFDDFFLVLGLTPIENTNDKCRVRKIRDREIKGYSALTQSSTAEVALSVSRWREAHRIEFTRLSEDSTSTASDLVRSYIKFSGPIWPAIRQVIQKRIVELSGQKWRSGLIFGQDHEISDLYLEENCPDFKGAFLKPASIDDFRSFCLLEKSNNEYQTDVLTGVLNHRLGKPTRPALHLYEAPENLSLFISPIGYQLFSMESDVYWSQASTRSYGRTVLNSDQIEVDRPVVIIQDIFEGSNYSHFLLDWASRVCLLIESDIIDISGCLFVLGGIPDSFHELVLNRVCGMYGLDRAQFIFPEREAVWRIRCPVYFFSDQKIEIMHPVHMAHTKSMRALRQLARGINIGSGKIKRVYISRSDTPLRRLANEHEVWPALQKRGFQMIRLSDLPLKRQISIIRGATHIVSPHGMGLTHIALHQHKPTIIELHNPEIGTDAYAFVGKALGFDYHALIGFDIGTVGHDYCIPCQQIETLLDELGVCPDPELANRSLLQPSGWQPGVQSQRSSATQEIPPPFPGSIILKHVRDDVTATLDNNVGWWRVDGLFEGAVYAGSCQVWIPANYKGAGVFLASGPELVRPAVIAADMSRREQWQPISISGTCQDGWMNLILRLDAVSGDTVYSSCWTLAPGRTS